MGPSPVTQCVKCGHSNPLGTARCPVCDNQVAVTQVVLETGTVADAGATFYQAIAVPPAQSQGGLAIGTVLCSRYEIQQFIGQGGMGAVYKALDTELDRTVALKVIRAELANDPKTAQRFKQELILARQVTHKNVIRIFDIGTHEGIKFITMEYVEGEDLSSLMEKRRFQPEEVARLIRQVCRALEAAHTEKVIHRDLKPQNIMIDAGGRVRVMDFGLARSVGIGGFTQTGMAIGTPAYMSPEQAKSVPLDERSDLFSVGVIFYELLTAQMPFPSDTLWGTLVKRTQEVAVPPVGVAPGVPPALNDMVVRCLAMEPADRYQSAAELADDLDHWLGAAERGESSTRPAARTTAVVPPAPATAMVPAVPPPVEEPPIRQAARPSRRMLLAAVGVIIVGVAGWFSWHRPSAKPPVPHQITTVVIADVRNHTGEAVFDKTLEPVLRIGLEGAGFINAYIRTNLPAKLDPSVTKFDETAARKLAINQGLNVVVAAALEQKSPGYRISATVLHAVTGNRLASLEATAANKDQVLFATSKLASDIRTALGDDTSEAAQRFGTETLTATSLEAVHEYAVAMQALSEGKFADARQHFSTAVDLDSGFGLAHAGMASTSLSLGETGEARKYIKLAMTNIDSMTERERYRTRGLFYVINGDNQKCVDEYSVLVSRYPSDAGGHNNLAICYSYLRQIPRAIEEVQRAAEILPKRPIYRFNLALYRINAGDFAAAEQEVAAAQQKNPQYQKGYLTLAYAQLGQGKIAEARSAYETLKALGGNGEVLALAGMADLAAYEGRFNDAAQLLSAGAGEAAAADKPEIASRRYADLALVLMQQGKQAEALAAAQKALSFSSAPKIRFLTAQVQAAGGDLAKARASAAALQAEVMTESQVQGRLIAAEVLLQEKNARQAIETAMGANRLVDTWLGHLTLGKAYLAAGSFSQAEAEFEQCLQRKGEAVELLMDDIPTYRAVPPVYFYLGQAREGMKNPRAADAFRTFQELHGKSGEDPLLTEARRHTP